MAHRLCATARWKSTRRACGATQSESTLTVVGGNSPAGRLQPITGCGWTPSTSCPGLNCSLVRTHGGCGERPAAPVPVWRESAAAGPARCQTHPGGDVLDRHCAAPEQALGLSNPLGDQLLPRRDTRGLDEATQKGPGAISTLWAMRSSVLSLCSSACMRSWPEACMRGEDAAEGKTGRRILCASAIKSPAAHVLLAQTSAIGAAKWLSPCQMQAGMNCCWARVCLLAPRRQSSCQKAPQKGAASGPPDWHPSRPGKCHSGCPEDHGASSIRSRPLRLDA